MKANIPLWFLPCLFVLENFLFAVDKVTDSGRKRYVFWMCMAGSLILFLLNEFVLHIENLPFAAETAFEVLPFALAGYGLRYISLPAFSRWKASVIALLLMVFCYVMACRFNSGVSVRLGQYGNIFVYMAAACCGIASMYLFCLRLPSNRALSYLGRNTMCILLLHKFPVLFFQVLFRPTVGLLARNHLPTGIVVSCLSIGMCLVAGLIMMRICPWMLGRSSGSKKFG